MDAKSFVQRMLGMSQMGGFLPVRFGAGILESGRATYVALFLVGNLAKHVVISDVESEIRCL